MTISYPMTGTRHLLLVVLYLVLFSQLAEASSRSRLAVLDFTCRTNLQQQEVDYITDIVRGRAREALPTNQYILMTRDNILELLPKDQSLANCLGECAIETGRNIGADYVVTGEVLRFGSELRVTLTLHETATGNLLKSVTGGAGEVVGLETPVLAKTTELLQPIRRVHDQSLPGGEFEVDRGQVPWEAGGEETFVVSFDSDPTGALVEYSDQIIGETPCSRPLAPGTYDIAFKKHRYVTHRQLIEVGSDVTNDLSVILTPDFGWLSVNSTPSGLEVGIDGETVGESPVVRLEVSCGAHEVMVRSDQYYPKGKQLVIDRGEHEELHVSPTPINGGLEVFAVDDSDNAVDGEVYVGGRHIGRTYVPLTVLVGRHDLEVRSGEMIWRGEVTVTPEQLNQLHIMLDMPQQSRTEAQKNSMDAESSGGETPVDFFSVEQPPVMIGGTSALYKKVKYPEMAEKASVEGVAQIVFTISKTGIPRDFEVRGEKPKGLGFAEAAIDALRQMRFQPGYQRDKAVPVRMSQTVRFNRD